MLHKLFVAIVVIIAVIAGICAMSFPREEFARLVMFRDFFDMALPILAFGALIKYLCPGCQRKCACSCGMAKCCCPVGKCSCPTMVK